MGGIGEEWTTERESPVLGVARVAVIGSGTMGLGIAEAAARAGIPTVLVKATGGDLDAARQRYLAKLDQDLDKGRIGAEDRDRLLEHLRWTTDLTGCAGVDLVIESVIEDTLVKERIIRAAFEVAPPHAVVATNTSTLPLAVLAASAPRPERLVALHFFNPVHAMPLVEVAGHPGSDDDALALAAEFARRLGKTPVRVAGTPGYVVNRLLVPYLLHAVELFADGLASATDIDRCMQLGCSMPLGPLALCDLIGNDLVLAMARTLRTHHREARFRPPGLLAKMVSRGWTGRKARKGFYDYAARPPLENEDLLRVRTRAAGSDQPAGTA